MPTADQVHAFLARCYKHDRFEGRNNPTWGRDYSQAVAGSTLEDLAQNGVSLISQHESMSGNPVYFDASLRVLTGDEWRTIVKGEAVRVKQTAEAKAERFRFPVGRQTKVLPSRRKRRALAAAQREGISGKPDSSTPNHQSREQP